VKVRDGCMWIGTVISGGPCKDDNELSGSMEHKEFYLSYC